MNEKAINDGQWNPWRLLQDAEFIIRDLSPDHDFPGRIRTAREAHDRAIASGTDPETAAEERGRDEIRQSMRPVSDYDKLAHEAWNVWDLDHLMAGEPNEITAAKITARVAVAIRDGEERGRRSGVELLREVRGWIADFPFSTSAGRDVPRILARIDAALAPRDSALNAKAGRSEDGLPVVNFDRDALHERAPRDSGKVCSLCYGRHDTDDCLGDRK